MTESLTNPMLWQPSPGERQSSAMHQLAERVGHENDLYEWSVSQPEAFWSEVWDECAVVGEMGSRAFVPAANGARMSTARFFPDASLSVVENFLQQSGSGEALVAIDEVGNRRNRSWDELRQRVAAIASALQQCGVGAGDRVVAWLPNSIEVVGLAGTVNAATEDWMARLICHRRSNAPDGAGLRRGNA